MLVFLQVMTLLLVAVTMALALAQALEFPGKLRLDRRAYYAMQPIYYPRIPHRRGRRGGWRHNRDGRSTASCVIAGSTRT